MRSLFRSVIAQEQPVVEKPSPRPDDKETGVTAEQTASEPDTDDDSIDKNAQAGVQNIEAMTKVWTKRDLYLAYILYVCQGSQVSAWC